MTRYKLMLSLTAAATALTAQMMPPGGPPHPGGGGWGPGPRGGGSRIIEAGPASRTPVTGAPYSAAESTSFVEKLGDGNVISRQDQSKVYRDSQGRVRVEHTGTPPGSQTPQTRITIFDPVAGFSYVLNPADMTAVKMAVQGRRGANTPPPAPANAPQPQVEDLGTRAVNGVAATGTRTTITIPAGQIGNAQAIVVTRETWISTALKVPVQIKSSDPRFGTTDLELTGITTSEPAADLFQVPANYTVTTRGRNNGGPRMQGMRGPRR